MEDLPLHPWRRHDPCARRFVNKRDDGRGLLNLQSKCDEIRDGRAVTRNGAQYPLERIGHIQGQDYFSAIVLATEPVEYAFQVHACGSERWVGPNGPDSWFEYNPAAHVAFETPAWVRDAGFYQIFPDRFWN